MEEGRNNPHSWIQFLRRYGPVPTNENQWDEHILKASKRLRIDPITFRHPAQEEVLACIASSEPLSVILTGTAGDGKTHLCRQVWMALEADEAAWLSKEPHLKTRVNVPRADGTTAGRTLHVIRDLSAWVPPKGTPWPEDRAELMMRLARSLSGEGDPAEVFLIAANDGQLTEVWGTLPDSSPSVSRARSVIEELLVEEREEEPGVPLRLFNLSRWASGDLLFLALDALLEHPAWRECEALNASEGEFFGPDCPVRHNVECLRLDLTRRRLSALLTLCDYCGVHIPIRQIMLLLANAILGHPDVKDHLMTSKDVPGLVRAGKVFSANLYRNLFGGNLPEARREGTLIFTALERFGVGQETANRIDNLLVYGADEDALRPFYERYLQGDTFYGATAAYQAAQREYIEGGEDEEDRGGPFMRQLVAQRQGLFFKLSDSDAEEMRLWELTVFHYAGEYLNKVVEPLKAGRPIERQIAARLVRGLNRVFTGRLVVDDRELLLATDPKASFGRVSQLLDERISVMARGDERVEVILEGRVPVLRVQLARGLEERLRLHLTRYEFLVRVADGALPNSFSKECYEDMLAFKSRLLSLSAERRARTGDTYASELYFQLLDVDESGKASVTPLEVLDA